MQDHYQCRERMFSLIERIMTKPTLLLVQNIFISYLYIKLATHSRLHLRMRGYIDTHECSSPTHIPMSYYLTFVFGYSVLFTLGYYNHHVALVKSSSPWKNGRTVTKCTALLTKYVQHGPVDKTDGWMENLLPLQSLKLYLPSHIQPKAVMELQYLRNIGYAPHKWYQWAVQLLGYSVINKQWYLALRIKTMAAVRSSGWFTWRDSTNTQRSMNFRW